ncbi:hypothetical protein B0H17DRAFT_1199105 [Mycena rosella]|uniref:Uncharacterized protein n=1 Tax=Mycena rosella TaxID=1033263 RepID=A0AAD7GME1_MYCRO|nr:hypothetical protein B0H17DRAFT_1199105 [Mycena rosella]
MTVRTLPPARQRQRIIACTRYRTKCLLEHCLFAMRLCEPNTLVGFVLVHIFLPSFSDLNTSKACSVCLVSSFQFVFDDNQCVFRGIMLAPAFSRNDTPAVPRARKVVVPIVDMGWLRPPQIRMLEDNIVWAKTEKRIFLKHSLETFPTSIHLNLHHYR